MYKKKKDLIIKHKTHIFSEIILKKNLYIHARKPANICMRIIYFTCVLEYVHVFSKHLNE